MDRIRANRKIFFWYSALWILFIVALYLSYGVYFVDTTSTKSKWVGLFAGAIALLFASCKILEISLLSSKNPTLEKVARYFKNGAFIFLNRVLKISAFVFFVLILLLHKMGVAFCVCLVTGGISALASLFFSSIATTKIVTRSSQFFMESNSSAIKQMFNSGIVVAFNIVALVIIPMVLLFHIFKDYQVINGFAFGACIVALLNNVCSATVKQAVDSASDAVDDFVEDIQKKDRRNPLLLLNGVSKGIFGVNILSCDLFSSLAIVLVASMTIGGMFLQLMGMFFPIIVLASGIFACIFVSLLTRIEHAQNPVKTLFVSMFCSNVLLIVISSFLVAKWMPDFMNLIFSIAIGAFGGYFICFAHSNLVFNKYKPVYNVSNASMSGFPATVKQTIKEGMGSVFAPAFILVVCLVLSFVVCGGVEQPSVGLFGISLAVLACISCVGLTIALNAFGITTSGVDTILETYEEDLQDSGFPKNNIFATTGKHIVLLGKNYTSAMAILSSILLLIAYTYLANLEQVDIINPYVLGSMLLGLSVPFVFCASVMGIVSKIARRLLLEVRMQFKHSPQILRYEMRPDYEKCVEISAINSTIQVIINLLFIVALGIYIALKLKEEALCGFVFGAIFSSFGLIFLTSGTSVVAKSAKRYFESQFSFNKNVNEYEAININEAIFASIKEIVVPSLNALIKFLAIASAALIPLFVF